ncbi:MAG: NAD(P)-dependent oxidoreductase [Candidatus Woesearchaeota archaeon]
MRVVIFDARPYDQGYLKKALKKHSVTFVSEPLSLANASKYSSAEVISCFITSTLSADILGRLPNLKFIATRSTGYDHIDMATCKARNIIVSNVPSYGENTVAEHTFALILSLARKVHKSYVRTLHDDFSIEGLRGFDLKEKTLGVIGTGKIGSHVIKIAKGFGMHVLAFDPYPNNFVAELLHFKYVANINEIYQNSDIITLHVPLTNDNKHMVGKKQLAMMKPSALLINTSRGDLIDTDALYESLRKEKLGGAGLDVIEGEELIKEEKELLFTKGNEEKLRRVYEDKAIFRLENVVFTPHNAFNSEEAIHRILETTAENINGFVMGNQINTLRL